MQERIIAIGALGGSGTRVVAQTLIKMGIYVGNDLNTAYDNLLFTRLFKNPAWYKTASKEDKNQRLSLFHKYMSGKRLTINDITQLYNWSRQNRTHKSRKSYYIKQLKQLYKSEKNRTYWAWKEPNTQIYAQEILEYFPRLKYVHVLRNGLDMAFSSNKQQLKNWGWKYDIYTDNSDDENELAKKQLAYWVKSTKEVFDITEAFKDRALILNYTNFCNNSAETMDRLIDFLGISISDQNRKELHELPQDTGSNNRYRRFNTEMFDKENVDFVSACGFQIT